jgi:hypothetical protein
MTMNKSSSRKYVMGVIVRKDDPVDSNTLGTLSEPGEKSLRLISV